MESTCAWSIYSWFIQLNMTTPLLKNNRENFNISKSWRHHDFINCTFQRVFHNHRSHRDLVLWGNITTKQPRWYRIRWDSKSTYCKATLDKNRSWMVSHFCFIKERKLQIIPVMFNMKTSWYGHTSLIICPLCVRPVAFIIVICPWYYCNIRSRYDNQGVYSISGRASYRETSRSLEAARFEFALPQSLWNWTVLGSSAAEMPAKFQSDTIIITSDLAASRLGGKASYRSVNRGPVVDDPSFYHTEMYSVLKHSLPTMKIRTLSWINVFS